VASSGVGQGALIQAIITSVTSPVEKADARTFCELPECFATEVKTLTSLMTDAFKPNPAHKKKAPAEALLLLTSEKALESSQNYYPATVSEAVMAARARLDAAGADWRSAGIEARYSRVLELYEACVVETHLDRESFSDRVDKILTHKLWGTLVFVAIMAVMFQSIFSFAKIPMEAMQSGVDWLGNQVSHIIPPGDLNSLIVGGVIAGVGAVVVFLPQILLLFFFIGLLEDTGYMARAAFLMDRLMSKVGLHGKSFIPMLSSFACAIPGIMATRTIESRKDRLVTILVAPLMSCSARLPVYTLLISACIPDRTVFGIFKLAGLTMLSMYLLGIIVALLMAWLFKKTLLRGEPPMLIMELPPYKRPLAKIVFRHMWDRSKLFLGRAGTVILGINILLWFFATYPRSSASEKRFEQERAAAVAQFFPELAGKTYDAKAVSKRVDSAIANAGAETNFPAEYGLSQRLKELEREHSGEQLRNSFAGHLGRLIEPVIAPLGFDWKMGIGIVASFAAREVFVSTMSTVYNVGEYDHSDAGIGTLAKTLAHEKNAAGDAVYTPLVAVTLMVFYVFAMQCVSTVAVVRRETNSWKWPFFQWVYMGALAWGLAFITLHGGRLLGYH
jgi:ferrous iron transport protein B